MSDCERMTWQQFDDACRKIAERIRHDGSTFKNIYGIPRGGLIVAVKLSHLLGLPIVLNVEDTGWNTLIVDDIADTGKTLAPFKCEDRFLCVATLYYHRQSVVVPDFWVLEKTSKWIVFPWEEEE